MDHEMKIELMKRQRPSVRIFPHLEEIEDLVNNGYSLKVLSEYFDMSVTQFYDAVRGARKIRAKQHAKSDTNAPEKQTPSIPSTSEENKKLSLSNTAPEHLNQKQEKGSQKPFNREELMKKIKPSAFKHRFNLDLEHT